MRADRREREAPILRRCATPRLAWLVLGYGCNKGCLHCYARGAADRTFATAEVLRKAEVLLSRLSPERVVLIGGEPTLYPDLARVVSRVRRCAGAVSLVSNGLRLASRELARSLHRAGLSAIDVSVGNPGPREPDLRVTGLNGLANAVDVFGPEGASAVVTIDGFKRLDQLTELLEDIEDVGVKRIAVNFALPNPASLRASRHTAPPRAVAGLATALYDHITVRTGLVPLLYLNLPLCLFPRSFVRTVFEAGHAVAGCHVITGEGLVIDPAGDILPCTHWVDVAGSTLDRATASLGTAAGFEGYWQRGAPMEWGRALFQPRHDACSACGLWANPCVGGCPLLWLRFDPAEHIPGWQA